MNKLKWYGMRENVFSHVRSYLNNRNRKESIEN